MPGGVLAWGFSGFCIGDGGAPCPDPEPQRTIGIVVAIFGAVSLAMGIAQTVRHKTVITGDEARSFER